MLVLMPYTGDKSYALCGNHCCGRMWSSDPVSAARLRK